MPTKKAFRLQPRHEAISSSMAARPIFKASLLIGLIAALVVSLGLGSLGCTVQAKPDTPPPADANAPQPSWAGKMQQLSTTLSSLLPMVSSRTKFSDEKNFARIEKDTRMLRALSHSLNTDGAPNSDPAMRMMSERFEEDVDRALENLRAGHRDYARHILKDTTAYCVYCHTSHTSSQNGPEFPRMSLNVNMTELNPLERAEFYSALRQFEAALDEYERVIADDTVAKLSPFEWERAARFALAIIVRVKHDPAAAEHILSLIRNNKSMPKTMKESLISWTKAVREWSKEKKHPSSLSANDQLGRAEYLISRAEKQREYPLDHAQDILYFRASAILTHFLGHHPRQDELATKALYLAGKASEATRDMNFWTLHETYFERCIESLPGSDLARQCYAKLSESLTLGYSGSGGVRIPPEIERYLGRLKALTLGAPDKARDTEKQ